MNRNLFGRTFEIALVVMIAAELLSVASFYAGPAYAVAFWVLSALFAFCAFTRFQVAVLIVLGEIFVGSYGRLFTVTVHGYALSLRYVFFGVLLLAFAYHLLRRSLRMRPLPPRLVQLLCVLLAVFAVGIVVGIFRGNTLGNIFQDGNGYAYLLLLPVLIASFSDAHQRHRALELLAAAVAAIAIRSLLLLALFAHHYASFVGLYHWVRSTRMEEVVGLGYNYYRIFSPTQVYALIGFCLFVGMLLVSAEITRRQRRERMVLVALSLTALLIGMSRTFWIALAVVLVILFPLFLRRLGWTFGRMLRPAGWCVVLLVINLVVLSFAANYPYIFNRPGAPATFFFFSDRSTDFEDAAIYSRYDLVRPMLQKIVHAPFLGSGFGTTVTFTSHDPRAQAIQKGVRTTYAFEWGYLDFWLKLGLVGTVVLAYALVALARSLWSAVRQDHEHRGVFFGFLIALFAVIIAHATSPYLNHPLGITFVSIATAYYFGVREKEGYHATA